MGLVMLAGATQSWTPAPLFSAFLGRPTISFLICLGLLYLLSNHPFFSVCWPRDLFLGMGIIGDDWRWRFEVPDVPSSDPLIFGGVFWWRAWPPSWPPRLARPVARHVNHMTQYMTHVLTSYNIIYICVCVYVICARVFMFFHTWFSHEIHTTFLSTHFILRLLMLFVLKRSPRKSWNMLKCSQLLRTAKEKSDRLCHSSWRAAHSVAFEVVQIFWSVVTCCHMLSHVVTCCHMLSPLNCRQMELSLN